MIELPGNRLSGLPLGELTFINELLEFDGNPILLHFQNQTGNDVIAYWVDFDKAATRWLYLKISKTDLFLYLSGKVNLNSIFRNPQTEYFFFVDISPNQQYIGVSMITPLEVPDKYMPGIESYFAEELPDYYVNYLFEIKFENDLKERSYIFKGEPSDKSHGNLLSARDGAFVLESVAKSADAYITFEAKSRYRQKYSSETQVNKVTKALTAHLSPLIAHAVIESFEVWFAMDTITLNDVDEIGSKIKAEIIEGYKRDVLDVDFTSEEDAKIICDKYDAVERKKIYGPILDILEEDSINITISDRQKSIQETHKPRKTSAAFTDLVIPKPSVEELREELERKNRIYTLVLSLKEGTDISRLSKKQILDNLLLFGNDIEVPYKIQTPIAVAGKSFTLKKPIIAVLRISDEDNVEIISPEFQINVKGKDMQLLNEQLRQQFLDFITPYLESKKTDLQTLLSLSEYLDLDTYMVEK